MYRVANQKINEGLSPVARFILGVFSGLFGLMMVAIAPESDKQIYFHLFGGFCLFICFACVVKGRFRQFLGSVIGICLLVLSTGYLVSQIFGGGPLFSERSEQSIFNAVLFTVFFGIPGLTYAYKTKFGFTANKNP